MLVSASWVMRYSASWALGGSANGGPVTVSRAGSPAARTLAISSSRSSRPGCGACPGVGRLAQHAHQPAHLAQRRTPGGRHLAHDRGRLARVSLGGVGGAVGQRDHHRDIVRHDVVHLPRDPGPFGGRGELGLLVPLPLQPPGPVLRGLEVGAPGAGVVAGEPGRRDQGGLGQERRRPLRFLDGRGEGDQHRPGFQRHGGEHYAPQRLVRGDRVKRHQQGDSVQPLGGQVSGDYDQHEDEPEDTEGVLAPEHQQNRLGGVQDQRQDQDPAGRRNDLRHR